MLFHEAKLFLLIYLFFSQDTPLILSASEGHAEACRVLVASKADVAARNRCRSPWRARNLPLTEKFNICMRTCVPAHYAGIRVCVMN